MDTQIESEIRHFLVDYQLGKSNIALPLETIIENRLTAEHMVQQARHSIYILSRNLDKPLYDSDKLIEALSQLPRNNPHSVIRILMHDATSAVKEGHRLINLSQRLSSYIQIRKIHSDYKDYNEAFLVADQYGVIHRQYSDRYEGIANFMSPLEAKKFRKLFTDIWEISEEDPQLRRLNI